MWQLTCTKCSAIIKNVVAPFFTNHLREDIDSPYSVLIDESTGITTDKYLGVSIIYFSNHTSNIVTTYLKLGALQSADAQGIIDCLFKIIEWICRIITFLFYC